VVQASAGAQNRDLYDLPVRLAHHGVVIGQLALVGVAPLLEVEPKNVGFRLKLTAIADG
jgi:hypothetical protein